MPSIGTIKLLFTRREFIVKTGIAAMALHPLMGCGSSSSSNGSRYPVPQYGDTYFTRDYTLPQTQDAEQLATFMESNHPEYSLNGWYFMGSVVDAANPDDTISFIIQAQRNATMGLVSGYEQFPVGIGYIRKTAGKLAGKWRLWFFTELDGTDLVSIKANPWNVVMRSPFQDDPLLSMQVVEGRMGQVGTQYIVKANVPGLDGSTLKADISFRDRYGVINQGYGTTAFCVQNITPEQRDEIMGTYGGYVQTYLEKTGDPMIDQGDFYYQMPFLDVESFSIRDGDTALSGTKGLLWADVIAASYDATAKTVYKKMLSTFFAIQFPDLNVAIMVLQIDSGRGSALTATLYDDDSQRTRNAARTPSFSWPMNGIIIEPDSTRQWYSNASNTYWPLRYHVHLESPQRNANLTIDMKMEDMEIVQENELTYAGPASVVETIDGRVVSGQVFIEVWSGVKE